MLDRERLRVGVIGTGSFARECHVPGIQSHPQAVVAAVCGRRIEAANRLADEFGVPCVVSDFRELCADPGIDAVTIATANEAHYEQALEALRHGKHVFCEKPLAMSSAQAREMTDAADASGCVHFVGFTFRYNQGIAELRRRIRSGDLGTPYLARIQYDRWDGLLNDQSATWCDPRRPADSGVLMDVGSHLFDIIRHVIGPVRSVMGFTHTVRRSMRSHTTGSTIDVQTDDLAAAWMKLNDDVHAQIFISRVTPPFGDLGCIEVIGSHGALRAALSRGGVDFLKISTPESPAWTNLPQHQPEAGGHPLALGRMMRSFVNACLKGHPDPELDAGFADGLAAQRAIDAFKRSQASGGWSSLDDDG
jgi:predicted dehydrogenase